jgi:hypothetical protein
MKMSLWKSADANSINTADIGDMAEKNEAISITKDVLAIIAHMKNF